MIVIIDYMLGTKPLLFNIPTVLANTLNSLGDFKSSKYELGMLFLGTHEDKEIILKSLTFIIN